MGGALLLGVAPVAVPRGALQRGGGAAGPRKSTAAGKGMGSCQVERTGWGVREGYAEGATCTGQAPGGLAAGARGEFEVGRLRGGEASSDGGVGAGEMTALSDSARSPARAGAQISRHDQAQVRILAVAANEAEGKGPSAGVANTSWGGLRGHRSAAGEASWKGRTWEHDQREGSVAGGGGRWTGATLVASEGVPLQPGPGAGRGPAGSFALGAKDFAVLSLCFVACAISAAFSVVLLAAVPALLALRRAALALEAVAMTLKEELPSTMAAVRLSGMEISDLTLELSDLSQEITEGVRSSTRAVKAAEEGINRAKTYAQSKTVAALEERAALNTNLSRPAPHVAGVAKRSKEAIAGARSALSQASVLGNVWKFMPFVGQNPQEKHP